MIWKGWVPNDWNIEMVASAWTRVAEAFAIDCPIRSVVRGVDIVMVMKGFLIFRNPMMIPYTFTGSYHVMEEEEKDETRFLAKNKLASILLQHGIAVGTVAEYVEQVVNGLSPGKILHEIGVHKSAQDWNILKEWLNKMNFPVPPPNASLEKAALKIQNAIRKKRSNLRVNLQANQVRIIPDHFLKHDGNTGHLCCKHFSKRSQV